MSGTGRADTEALKRNVMERLLNAWQRVPELRLGQLIVNATLKRTVTTNDIFYTEDLLLVEQVEAFVEAEVEGKPPA